MNYLWNKKTIVKKILYYVEPFYICSMNIQEILVYIVLIIAVAFLGKKFFFKMKNSDKNSDKNCGDDCGCN